MATKAIVSRAPARVDLAGGTLDIWPLYLFLDEPTTVNLGINLYAEARLELDAHAPRVVLKTIDQNNEAQFSWKEFLSTAESLAQLPPGLQLHRKLTLYFAKKILDSGVKVESFPGLSLSTSAQSPAGAGLGGSSTLSIAMVGALGSWAAMTLGLPSIDPQVQGEEFIEIVRDIETTVIQVPAGMQDYYGAMYGGLQRLSWKPGRNSRAYLPKEIIPKLSERLLLFYSGQSRNSGINNWDLFKKMIDGVPKEKGHSNSVQNQFQEIANQTRLLDEALLREDWSAVGKAIAGEWKVRRSLGAQISTEEIDKALFEANQITPIAGKICGAGGGGCFFVFLTTTDSGRLPQDKAAIVKRVTSLGMRHLDCAGVPSGLSISTS